MLRLCLLICLSIILSADSAVSEHLVSCCELYIIMLIFLKSCMVLLSCYHLFIQLWLMRGSTQWRGVCKSLKLNTKHNVQPTFAFSIFKFCMVEGGLWGSPLKISFLELEHQIKCIAKFYILNHAFHQLCAAEGDLWGSPSQINFFSNNYSLTGHHVYHPACYHCLCHLHCEVNY